MNPDLFFGGGGGKMGIFFKWPFFACLLARFGMLNREIWMDRYFIFEMGKDRQLCGFGFFLSVAACFNAELLWCRRRIYTCI